MKTLVTYLAALFLGLATCFLFKDAPAALGVFNSISTYLIDLAAYIYLPVMLVTFSSAVASLLKDRKGFRVALSMFCWALGSSVILAVLGAVCYLIFPLAIPTSSSAGLSAAALNNSLMESVENSTLLLIPENILLTISYATRFFFPLVIIAWIFGAALKPTSDIIRPAYQTMNSLSEVGYRIARFSTIFGSILAYFTSTSFFLDSASEHSAIINGTFMGALIISSAFIFFGIVPLLYAIYTRFKRNPYSVMVRTVPSYVVALTSNNILATDLFSMSMGRTNLGVQKRVTSITTPVLSIFARGGTAFVATYATLMVIQALAGRVDASVAFTLAFASALTSFSSSLAIGEEILLTSVFALRLTGINLLGRETVLIALLPLLNGIAIMIDTLILNMGAIEAGSWIRTNVRVPIKDTV